MTEPNEDEKTKEFNKVVDATSNFLKAIFPHGQTLVKKIKTKSKDIKNDSDKK